MNMFLTLAYLFFIGSTLDGWLSCCTAGFSPAQTRSASGSIPASAWGPMCPCTVRASVFFICWPPSVRKNGVDTAGEKLLLFAGMALSMTAIEYIAGIVSLKFMHIRLWDYSKQWGNIQGLICPAFSVLWAAVSAVYYFCVHPYILDALDWLSRNLALLICHRLFLWRVYHRSGLFRQAGVPHP